jgi:RepB plasmid partitioning protein/ParB-like nuclease family protein
MTDNSPKRPVRMAFEENTVRVAIADVLPLRVVRPALKSAKKYAQIATSIRELGIIEPPVVARQRGGDGKYLLLDGHLRIEALKDMGETEVVCLLSTDDEAVTYNKRVSRIAIVQEHKMIMKAIERGVPEQRIAAALDIDVASLRVKVRLFNGICPEVIDMLKDKDIHINAISILKKMLPLRQIEASGVDGGDEQVHGQLCPVATRCDSASGTRRTVQAQTHQGIDRQADAVDAARVGQARPPIQADRADLRQRPPRSGTRQRLRRQAGCKCPHCEIPNATLR